MCARACVNNIKIQWPLEINKTYSNMLAKHIIIN